MILRYCDGCGAEIIQPRDIATKLEFVASRREKALADEWPHNNLTVSTLRAVSGTWNGGDVCESCIRRVVHDSLARVAR